MLMHFNTIASSSTFKFKVKSLLPTSSTSSIPLVLPRRNVAIILRMDQSCHHETPGESYSQENLDIPGAIDSSFQIYITDQPLKRIFEF
ncbi:hypothetical protein P5673_009707 [Acropora cervicornis]|uniref:Uncharacterized protein n=1 Tax=Acropora cervicornis TaxID=6130 RepID=A0AAD9V9H6_ACRCE|nr:hypothetical protein P5673_009707 [Acropora cervicornis]